MKNRKFTRVFALLLSILLVIGLFSACGKTEDENKETLKVGLILTGTLGDESIHDQAYAGLQQVAADFDCETKYVECTDSSMYIDSLQSLCELGYQLICCDAFTISDAMLTVAKDYPDVRFMILGTTVDGGENVTCIDYASHEASFLAGVAAAMKSESGVIGFIGGMEIPSIQKFEVGFVEGVSYINPDAKVIIKYVGSDDTAWNDPATAKALTLDVIANGADVCYHAAGASGMGMIEACNEQNVYAIGVNTDQAHLAPDVVLTSALTKGDRAIYLFVENYVKGTPLSGATILSCTDGGVGLAEGEFMTDDIWAKVNECTEKIISGEIKVTDVTAS